MLVLLRPPPKLLEGNMFEKLTELFIKWFNIKEKSQVRYLSGAGKSSNYDGGELGSTDGNKKE